MNAKLAGAIYFGLQRLRREPVKRALRDVLRTEFLSLDELYDLQLQRFKKLATDVAENVPYFSTVFGPHLGRIAEMRTHQELQQLLHELPLETKEIVREHELDILHRNRNKIASYSNRTSGSSGTPFVFPCDNISWAYRHALHFRCYQAFGIEVGDPYMYVVGMAWGKGTSKIRLKDAIFNRTRISAFSMNPLQSDEYIKALRSRKPKFMLGYPSAIYSLATTMANSGYDGRDLPLKAVFTQSEALREYQRNTIGQVFGVPVVNTYGSAESGLMAYECPARKLHLNIETTVLREPSTGNRTTSVTTDLFQRSFPIVNYRQGDELVFEKGLCGCGRQHPMLAMIDGRSGDDIRLPNGKILNANAPSYVFKVPEIARRVVRYRFINRSDEKLELLVVPVSKLTAADQQLLRDQTYSAFQSHPDDFPFEIVEVDEIPLFANAKHKDFVREN